jgi:hypothetical protein
MIKKFAAVVQALAVATLIGAFASFAKAESTDQRFKLHMATITHGQDSTFDTEYLFRDNQSFMKQTGLGQ